MGKVYFLFGVHNHQPTGNLPQVFEEACEKCYFPFLSLLERFPSIKFSIHNSGCLYDWLKENKKEYIEILKKLVERKQTEIISGAYYEPILPIISDEDKIAQIKFMNDFIKKEFKTEPYGFWLAERVWESYLAKILNECAIKYTFLDDAHFRYAGFREKEFFGFYTTEEELHPLYIFPISKTLRYKIPFSLPEEAIEILENFSQGDSDVLITLFDDGEKFGLWPHTYQWVYENKWLEKFLSLLEISTCIETITFKEAIEKFSSQGIIYLPTCSYEEMGEWVLQDSVFPLYQDLKNFLKESGRYQDFKDFLRGGIFRNFYRKYACLNYLHKRMLYLSKKIHKQCDFKKDKKIFINLWKGQVNCGYWHGVFGGFYLPHIRASLYEHLIKAEDLFGKKYLKRDLEIEEVDFNLDGKKEIFLKNKKLIACFSSKGSLLELSLRKPPFNLLNTITRQKESYHRKVKEKIEKKNKISTIHDIIAKKEENLEEFLIYDQYEKVSFLEHLLEKDINVSDFLKQRKIFNLNKDIYYLSSEREKNQIILNFTYKKDDLEFTKKIIFSLSQITVWYNFARREKLKLNYFGVEFNFSFLSLKDLVSEKDLNFQKPNESPFLDSFKIIDNYKKIILDFKFSKAKIFTTPIYTVTSSENGFEKNYQQISLLFLFNPEKDFFISFRISNETK